MSQFRTPASEPYPPTPPPAPESSPRTNAGVAGLIAVGGAMMAIGGFLPRAKLTIGPLYVKTEGVAWLLVLIGVAIVVLALVLRTRLGAVILLVVSALALLLTIAAMSGVKDELTHWALTTGASQVATQFGVSATTVASRIQDLINAGQSHLQYQIGLWLALVGSILALLASIGALLTTRRAPQQEVLTGPAWAPPAQGGMPQGGTPPAPPAAPPSDWTAPPADWTAPPASTTSAPSAPPVTEPATPPPPAEPAQEPESFPPPPPPPPS